MSSVHGGARATRRRLHIGVVTAAAIRPGQTVALGGIIRGLPTDLNAKREEWSLSAANIQTLNTERVYLDAASVQVTGR